MNLRQHTPDWAVAAVTLLLAALIMHRTFTTPPPASAPLTWELALTITWAAGAAFLCTRPRTRGTIRAHAAQRRQHSAIRASTTTRATRPIRPILAAITTMPPTALITALTLALSLGSLIGAWALLHIPLPLTQNAILENVAHATRSGGSALLILAVLAGAAEEFFFRIGLANLTHGWVSWVLPNLLYTLVTAASGNLALTLAAPIVGIFATAAYQWSGSWLGPIIVHLGWSLTMVGLFPLLVTTLG